MVRFIPANHSLPTSERRQFGLSGNNQKMVVEVKSVAAHRMLYGSSNNLPSQFPVLCIDSERGHPLGIFQGDPLRNSFGLILLEMAIVLVVSRVVRFLLKPLKQPKVVSDIIGGVFVGPSLLGHNKTFSTRVFPENTKFLVRNMGIMGFMYFLFISGVKMDLTLVKKSGRKHVAIAFLGVLAPLLTVMGLAYIIRPHMDKELAKHSSIGAVASSVAIPAFPVLFPILKELNLLSSEVGRMALSTAIISDAIGLNAIVAFEAIKQGEADSKNAIWYVISTIVLALFMVTAVRKCMIWIIARTPEGKPVDQTYVAAILLGVLIIGFLTDMFGIAIGNGPLWLGLVIPDGPPLGSTLVDKTEMFIMEILMPFSFAYIGLYTDVYSMASIGWSGVAPLFYMVLLGYAFKFIATLLPSLFYNIPVRDSLTLSLIMSLRGQVEIFVFIHWMDKKIVGIPRFSLMILLTIAVTAVATPLIAVFYDPTRPYMVNRRRTIQHTPPNTEMGIILCIHDRESVNGLINLIEISYPTTTSKFDVYAIHLVELLGRAAPVFVDHNKEEEDDRQSNAHTTDDSIYSALKLYQEARAEFVNIHTFTVQAPKRTMYQNICEMALLNKATIIITPYHKEHLDDVTGTEIVRKGVQSVNSSVLAHAPCSVGVLVDKGELRHPIVGRRMRQLELNFVVLFLGGADAREALAYAERMVVNPDVTLTVIRFLSHNYDGDDEMEKKLDDGIVTSFWVKNEANERVIYREVVVKNGEETVAAIQALNDGTYDLWIMGRKQGINPILLEGLLNWSENIQELGVIGDIVAAASFGTNGSVLVIQQQILRGQGATGVDAAGAVDATKKSPCNFLSRFV